jgi:hypothetical protein
VAALPGLVYFHILLDRLAPDIDLGYEAVGEKGARLETFEDWKETNKEGVVYYLLNGRVRGVLLWERVGKDRCRARIDRRSRSVQFRESQRTAEVEPSVRERGAFFGTKFL